MNKNNLAIIPARSGSKGLKDKNIKELNGKPLIAYAILEAQKTNIFDAIHVSSRPWRSCFAQEESWQFH